jgi:hypothetical protein
MSARIATKAPGDRFFRLQHTARLHIVVDRERIDLVIGRVGGSRDGQNPHQPAQTYHKKRDYGSGESPTHVADALDSRRGQLHYRLLVLDWEPREPVRLAPRHTDGNGLALVNVLPELIVHLRRQSPHLYWFNGGGGAKRAQLALVVHNEDLRPGHSIWPGPSIASESKRSGLVPGWLGVSINGETAAKAEQRQGSAPHTEPHPSCKVRAAGRRRGKT